MIVFVKHSVPFILHLWQENDKYADLCTEHHHLEVSWGILYHVEVAKYEAPLSRIPRGAGLLSAVELSLRLDCYFISRCSVCFKQPDTYLPYMPHFPWSDGWGRNSIRNPFIEFSSVFSAAFHREPQKNSCSFSGQEATDGHLIMS